MTFFTSRQLFTSGSDPDFIGGKGGGEVKAVFHLPPRPLKKTWLWGTEIGGADPDPSGFK